MVEVLNEKSNDFSFHWVYVYSPTPEELKTLAKKYKLPRSAVQDCLEPEHMPKYELLDEVSFMIMRRYDELEAKSNINTIQGLTRKIAVFCSNDLFISIHRSNQPFIYHLKYNFVDKGKCTSTYQLLFKLMDFALTTFERPAYELSEELHKFESEVFLKTHTPSLLEKLYNLRAKADVIRRVLLMTSEIVDNIHSRSKDEIYTRDTLDLFKRINNYYDTIVTNSNHLLNIYFSLSSNRINEVMRILTIFSVFFMPLTFLVGVYGMNFKHMPELDYKWAYPATWGVMVLITMFIFVWFKRKKWL